MAKWQEKLRENETSLWKDYQESLDYQTRIGLREKIPACVDFYEGRQWPQPTESTKNLPRPVVNIIKMICRSKKGAILSTPVKILYKSFSPYTDIERFNAFATSLFKEIGQDELDRRGIDDAIKKGSYFFHYYWDSEAISSADGERGSVRCELIDPLNIFFANPSEYDEQKQDWIIISSRKEISYICQLADTNLTANDLLGEDFNDTHNAYETASSSKATLLTRYFKQNGEVWCERATKSHIISKPFKLIPEKNDSDSENYLLKSSKPRQAKGRKPCFGTLYPVVCGYYERKEGSIYGLGEVEGLIPNQKAINFNIAMSLLNAQQCAWGKYIALPNALNGQKISNVPGQVLIDYSGTGEGIKKLPELELSKIPMELVTTLSDLTRSVSGSSEVMTGEAYTSSLSGAAIAYLQAQAQVPIEELKNNFWSTKRKQGLVIAQFLKNYFWKRAFIKQVQDASGNLIDEFDDFYSCDYENSLFEVTVEAVGGTKASVASDISLLDTCLRNGSISLETYIKAYPASAITNKEEILKQIEVEKRSEIQKLRDELSHYKSKKGSKNDVKMERSDINGR